MPQKNEAMMNKKNGKTQIVLATEPLREPRRHGQDDDVRQDIARGDPGDLIGGRIEVPGHLGQGDVDDRRIQTSMIAAVMRPIRMIQRTLMLASFADAVVVAPADPPGPPVFAVLVAMFCCSYS